MTHSIFTAAVHVRVAAALGDAHMGGMAVLINIKTDNHGRARKAAEINSIGRNRAGKIGRR